MEPKTGRVLSYPQDTKGKYYFNRFWWSQNGQRVLTMESSLVFTPEKLEEVKALGQAPLGYIERSTGEWKALGYLFDPRLAEDGITGEDVNGPGLSVWSADSSRFVIGHVAYKEEHGQLVWSGDYTWVQWDVDEFKTLNVRPGYIPVYPVGSNELDYLPKASWIYEGKLKREK